MRYIFIIFIAFLFVSSPSHGAMLYVERDLLLCAIDGSVITGKVNLPINVEEGNRQLVIRYKKGLPKNHRVFSSRYRHTNNEHIMSRPYLFTVNIKLDTRISVQEFQSASQAKSAIRKGLVFVVENEQGKTVVGNAVELHGNGSLPFSAKNLSSLIKVYNQRKARNVE
jgi:ribosomal protein L35AE/L33A